MGARAAAALLLATLAWAGSARAADDLACAQYREPMAYNACLARHGPKANTRALPHGGRQPGGGLKAGTGARPPPFHRWRRPGRTHGRMHMEFPVR